MSLYTFDLSYEEIEQNYGQLYLLQYLYPDLKIGKNNSPLRRDNNPSFLIGKNPNGSIYWKDQRTNQTGNLYTLIILREPSVTNFSEALRFINRQLIRLNIQPVNKPTLSKVKKERFKLGVVRRDWNKNDLRYWAQFGISQKTLEFYRVSPVDWIYLNPDTSQEKIIKAEEYSYVYKEFKDGIVTLKVYQPFALDSKKWFSDCTESVSAWHGWEQMSSKGEVLIWTKSLKDVMSIKETTGFDAVSLQSESWMPKIQVVDELKQRFKQIFLLYDNDFNSEINWGRNLGYNISLKFNVKQIEIPTVYQCKDYSRLYHLHNYKAVKILNNMILT